MVSLDDRYSTNQPTAGAETPAGEARKPWLPGRIGHTQLARMCQSVGTGLHAGVDVRRVFQLEAGRGGARYRDTMAEIRDRVADGESLSDALRARQSYFPPMLCEMVEVGERTGRVEQIFFRLGEHYDNLVRLRRLFLFGIAWPLTELLLGLAVVGLLIWVLGMTWTGSGKPPITFLGLYGTEGLVIYCSTLGGIALVLVLGGLAVRNGWINLDPLIRMLLPLPGIGTGLKTMAISRLTWSLALATDSDLDARRAAELAVRTTQNTYYTRHIESIKQSIRAGSDMHQAFRATRVFPEDFLNTLETGEIGGSISEAMLVLAKEYEERAKSYYRALTVAAGVGVACLVGALMITMIFQMFSQYLGILNSAGEI